jgi:hypothetical protein
MTTHKNFNVKFKLGKEMCMINYTVGVKQGNNMAPLLFLFLLQAVAEVLQKMRDHECNFEPVTF